MKVWVVMGNDFPAGAFSTKEIAELYCQIRRADDERKRLRIYWRVIEFTIDQPGTF